MQPGFDPDNITLFARTNARGQDVPFGIKAKDRQRHMYVIGKTGMGKSTLLENMAAQDILNGEGMCFIDPHGSAIEVLLEYVPEHRLDDVVYFAPFDMEHPISFNIMEDVGADTRHLVVSGLMSTFKKIWEDAWSARMEYILTNALLALIEYPDTTLLSVNRMLADKAYRDKVVDYIKDPAVKAYWVDEFANYTERFAAEALPAIQNKIGQFTGNPLIRNIIGQPKSSFNVRKMMDEKKILLVNLSKGLVGETNADLLGSMLITKIYLSAMSRAELPPAQMKLMPNFYFYVDEFQSFANSTFANILSEARKYHLNLIIAHQYVDQMDEKIRDAVFGNVGTTVAFRVGPFDAEVLEPIFSPPFMASDLVNLGAYQIYLTLMIDGAGSAPFSAVTLPPVETPAKSHKFMVIKRSQEKFCKPRSEVEQLVTDLHTPEERIEASAAGEGGNKGGFTKPSAFHKVNTDKYFAAQKESIKAGTGNRPPKPGKKPGTNRQDAGKAGNQVRPQGVSESKGKSAPSQKSPDELRALLADLAKDEKTKKGSEDKSKTAQNATQKPDSQSDKKNRDDRPPSGVVNQQTHDKTSHTRVDREKRTNEIPSESKSDSKADLQAVLASMGAKDIAESSPTKSNLPVVEKSSPTSGRSTSGSNESSSRQQLAGGQGKAQSEHIVQHKPQSAKKAEVSAANTDINSGVTSPALAPVKPSQQPGQRVENQSEQSVIEALKSRLDNKHTPREKQTVVSAATNQSEDGIHTSHTATTRTDEQTTVSTSKSAGADLDVATVKKMLRHSGNERPPGLSR